MADSCCCGGNSPKALIFACSGCSNVGQLSNDLAIKLTREGYGKMSCLAGVGAHISGFVVSAKDSQRLVAIDGCDLHCALKVLQHAESNPHLHLTLTDRGFVKKHGASVSEDELERAFAIAVKGIQELPCSTDL
jgi:uncharacterized metal-binding protein